MPALAAVLVLVFGAGCGETGSGPGDGPLRVYMSVPLSGERAAEGRRLADGAERALAEAGGHAGDREIELEVLDDTGGGTKWSAVATGDNARTASEDADTIAYIGELDTTATATSLPITDLAEIPQLVLGEVPSDLDVDNEILPIAAGKDENAGGTAMQLALDAIEAAGDDGTDRTVVREELRDLAASRSSP